ncbi:hypothetical protein D3C86_1472780 [compost metagenome]
MAGFFHPEVAQVFFILTEVGTATPDVEANVERQFTLQALLVLAIEDTLAEAVKVGFGGALNRRLVGKVPFANLSELGDQFVTTAQAVKLRCSAPPIRAEGVNVRDFAVSVEGVLVLNDSHTTPHRWIHTQEGIWRTASWTSTRLEL